MMMVLNRNHVLSTLTGHTVGFVKGEPVFVPKVAIREAVAIGATPADGSDVDILEDKKESYEPFDLSERAGLIMEAILLLVERNDREDFTAAGAPRADAISKEVGFRVQAKEFAPVWQRYHDELAEAGN
jgi:hypothetical protein